jgi:catechol 2,3-dioxygenase-like lactoylglutathione lyase family enzyme
MAMRLRQVALVAPDLGPALESVRDALGVEACYHDPGVAEFGLENVLFPIGDQFLEIVAPIHDGTTAGRLLDRRGGAGGYMAIFQCDDLDRRRERLPGLSVRAVWQVDLDDARTTHLHPRDIGGAIVSVDQMGAWDAWRWAGPSWRDHVRTDVVSGITGLTLSAADPAAMATRWASVLELSLTDDTTAQVDNAWVHFERPGARGEGLDGLTLKAADQDRAGSTMDVCGVQISLV